MKDFKNQIAFITGGASGAGFGQAQVFGRAGAKIDKPQFGPGSSFEHRYGAGSGDIQLETFSGSVELLLVAILVLLLLWIVFGPG